MLGVIGDVVQDMVVWQLEATQDATDTRCDIYSRRGGSAANVAAFAGSRYPTRFIGCVGDDVAGIAMAQELAGHGVDVRLQKRGRTGVIVIVIDPDGERLMFPSRGASELLQPVDEEWLAGLELLHCPAYGLFGGSTAAATRDAIGRVRDAGALVCIDLSSAGMIRSVGVQHVLDLLAGLGPDLLSANEDECALLQLTLGGGPGPNLALLPKTVLLARAGAAPTVILEPGHPPTVVPVPPVAGIRDLTGAGDAFNAGFLTAYLSNGRDLIAACRAGHALAERVLRSAGATELIDDQLIDDQSADD